MAEKKRKQLDDRISFKLGLTLIMAGVIAVPAVTVAGFAEIITSKQWHVLLGWASVMGLMGAVLFLFNAFIEIWTSK